VPAALAFAITFLVPADATAQRAREIGLQAIVAAAEPAAITAGFYGALRTTRRTRLAVTAGVGGSEGEVAWRGELVGHFLLNPGSVRSPGLYGGGGLAVAGASEAQGFVVVLIGLEGTPGGRSGWSIEAGLGGGFRAAVGYRWRVFGRR
jgi:hypothetical protein